MFFDVNKMAPATAKQGNPRWTGCVAITAQRRFCFFV